MVRLQKMLSALRIQLDFEQDRTLRELTGLKQISSPNKA